ncbi:UNVERIFIED_CONTAM: hypothetical protein HDU68_007518 [Siphonaria sp. JEL0065]|nr:hypothetical protein HDU68_007518 [Siphonaria sp. JEL0065]
MGDFAVDAQASLANLLFPTHNFNFKNKQFQEILPETAPESLDKILDFVSGSADDELNQHYAEILKKKHGGNGTPKNLNVPLHEHQLDGLAWMCKMEDSILNGGILADDMGLGKTIQALSIILSNKPPKYEYIKGTLIVCPVALLRQWEREINSKSRGLSVHIHHGPDRTKSKTALREYDVMVTNERMRQEEVNPVSLEIIKQELKAGPLFRARWHRIILDEAHFIKNRKSAVSMACADLESKKKFCLTGTPIQNSADEMYSLFRFLKIPRYQNFTVFDSEIGRYLKAGRLDNKAAVMGMTRLRQIIISCLLRRTKQAKKRDGTSILEFPKRQVDIIEIEFSQAERDFYDAVSNYASKEFRKLDNNGTVMQNFSHVLLLILRLRQSCCHPHMIKAVFKNYVDNDGDIAGIFQRIMGRGARAAALAEDDEDDRNVGTRRPQGRRRNASGNDPLAVASAITLNRFGIGNQDDELFVSSDEENRPELAVKPLKRKERDAQDYDSPTSKKLRIAKRVMDTDVFERILKEVNLEEGGLLDSECPNCLDFLTDPVITKCGHAFCQECITGYLSHHGANLQEDHDEENIVKPCPVCRKDVSEKTLTDASWFVRPGQRKEIIELDEEEYEEEPKPEVQAVELGSGFTLPVEKESRVEDVIVACHDAESEEKKDQEPLPPLRQKVLTIKEGEALLDKSVKALHPDGKFGTHIPSAKLAKMINILNDIQAEDSAIKTIIFSQFTSYLDVIEQALMRNGYSNFLRYDGSMKVTLRNDTIDKFASDDFPIMIVSLKAGSVGLDLSCASRVIMMDPWWNPAVEDQAIDRVHRIGQRRKVQVYRLVIKNSFEDRIMMLQENKRAIAAGALGEGSLQIGRLSLKDLRFLFRNDAAFLAPVGNVAEAAAVVAAADQKEQNGAPDDEE